MKIHNNENICIYITTFFFFILVLGSASLYMMPTSQTNSFGSESLRGTVVDGYIGAAMMKCRGSLE